MGRRKRKKKNKNKRKADSVYVDTSVQRWVCERREERRAFPTNLIGVDKGLIIARIDTR